MSVDSAHYGSCELALSHLHATDFLHYIECDHAFQLPAVFPSTHQSLKLMITQLASVVINIRKKYLIFHLNTSLYKDSNCVDKVSLIFYSVVRSQACRVETLAAHRSAHHSPSPSPGSAVTVCRLLQGYKPIVVAIYHSVRLGIIAHEVFLTLNNGNELSLLTSTLYMFMLLAAHMLKAMFVNKQTMRFL